METLGMRLLALVSVLVSGAASAEQSELAAWQWHVAGLQPAERVAVDEPAWWGSDVATLTLIEHLGEFEAAGTRDFGRRPAHSKPEAWDKAAARLLFERCGRDELSGDEWEALIRLIVDDPQTDHLYARVWRSRLPQDYRRRLLGWAARYGRISDEDVARLDAGSHVEFHAPEAWPVGVPFDVQVRLRHWRWERVRVTFFAEDGVTPKVEMRYPLGPEPELTMFQAFGWWAGARSQSLTVDGLGQAGEPYQLVLIEALDGDGWREVRRYEGVVGTRVRGEIDAYVRPTVSGALDDAIQRDLGLALYVDRQHDFVGVAVFPDAIADVLVGAGNPELAVRIEARQGGELVARGSVTWWARYGVGSVVDDRMYSWQLRLDVVDGAEWDDEAGEVWTVRLVGDPVVALQTPEREAYWAGDVTIEVEARVGVVVPTRE